MLVILEKTLLGVSVDILTLHGGSRINKIEE